MGIISLFIHSRSSRCYPKDCSSQAFHTLHLSPPLFKSPWIRFKLCPGLKRSGTLTSWADRRREVDIATVDCGTLTSREYCCSGVDIATVDFRTGGFSGITVSGVWIRTKSAVSTCGGNLDSICSDPVLFSEVGDIGSEEQRRALMWSWWHQITHPSCNFIEKDRASIPSKTCWSAIWG